MIPRYLLCLFLCTAVPPAGFSIYIFINTTVTFIGTSGHSVQMSWIFVSTRIFIFSLEIADIFILPWYQACLMTWLPPYWTFSEKVIFTDRRGKKIRITKIWGLQIYIDDITLCRNDLSLHLYQLYIRLLIC